MSVAKCRGSWMWVKIKTQEIGREGKGDDSLLEETGGFSSAATKVLNFLLIN